MKLDRARFFNLYMYTCVHVCIIPHTHEALHAMSTHTLDSLGTIAYVFVMSMLISYVNTETLGRIVRVSLLECSSGRRMIFNTTIITEIRIYEPFICPI